jgi:hypothetical protein
MAPAKRTRLYVGLLVVAAGVGASLLGLRAERFVGTRHGEIVEAHAERRRELVQMAANPNDDSGRQFLAKHDEEVVPRALERYHFGLRVAKSMQYGGMAVAVIGIGLLVSYVVRRRLQIGRGNLNHR